MDLLGSLASILLSKDTKHAPATTIRGGIGVDTLPSAYRSTRTRGRGETHVVGRRRALSETRGKSSSTGGSTLEWHSGDRESREDKGESEEDFGEHR